jgi:hypothetical protein
MTKVFELGNESSASTKNAEFRDQARYCPLIRDECAHETSSFSSSCTEHQLSVSTIQKFQLPATNMR